MRRSLGRAVWMVGALALAAPAWAAEAVEEGADHGPMAIDFWQALFTIVVFGLLVAILSKFAFRPILEGLQNRERYIRESLESAEKKQREAEERLQAYQQKLDQARQEMAQMVEEGRQAGETARRRIEDEARRTSEELLERARREIGVARDSALRSIYDEASDLAASLAASALKRHISPEEHQRLMLDALRELQQRPGHGDN